MVQKPNNPIPDKVVDLATRQPYIEPVNVPLDPQEPGFDSGGGGGEPPVEPQVSMREYIDKADEAVESRLARQLDKLPTKGTVWAAAGTVLGILLAALACGGDRFDGGVSVSPTIYRNQVAQEKRDSNQDAKAALMDRKLDLIIQQTSKK